MLKVIKRLFQYFYGIFKKKCPPSRQTFTVKHQLNHPASEEMTEGELVLVGHQGHEKWACFRCPGGCGEKLMLSLNQNRRPRWAVTIDESGRPTIYPSVRTTNECFCHFWVQDGEVSWCSDTGLKEHDDQNG